MKVIKNNFENNNENIRREIECTNCKSILEYENKDIISERCINGKQYIICPCCNYIIILNNFIPRYSKKNLIPYDKETNNSLYSICPNCGVNKFTRLQLIPDNVYACLSCGFEMEMEE